MPEKPQIEEVLFPVACWDVFARPPEAEQTGSLFDESEKRRGQGVTRGGLLPAPGHQAIVDVERRRVFAVVSDGYKLVTNQSAIDQGEDCFRRVFSQRTLDRLELFNITMPATRSFCHVDFTMKDYESDFPNSDTWRPFLRVTNSYNRTKPLRFDFGFCRWICKNGMIFGAEQVSVQRHHTQVSSGTDWLAGLNLQHVKLIEAKFLEKTENLRRYFVPPEMMLPLACKVFNLEVSDKQVASPHTGRKICEMRQYMDILCQHYFGQLGHNGYAALNVLTEFATRPKVVAFSPASRVHDMQVRSGRWVDEFISAMEKRDFNFEIYIGDYHSTATRIRNA